MTGLFVLSAENRSRAATDRAEGRNARSRQLIAPAVPGPRQCPATCWSATAWPRRRFARTAPVRRCAAGWVLRLIATGQPGIRGRLLARFALVYVDFATRQRVLKGSCAAYADIIRTQRARSADGLVAYRAS